MVSTMFKILAFLFIIYFCYLAYLDYKYREVKRRLVLACYPIVCYLNFKVSENLMLTIFGFLILFITLYVAVLMKPNSFGAIDILMAPLVTIWFNEYSLVYSLVLIIINSLIWKIGLVENLFSREGEQLSNPFLITMLVVFILFLMTSPNNFDIILSLN